MDFSQEMSLACFRELGRVDYKFSRNFCKYLCSNLNGGGRLLFAEINAVDEVADEEMFVPADAEITAEEVEA